MDLTGKQFGRLTVIKRVDDYIFPSGKRVPMWECICSCKEHNIIITNQTSLLNDKCKSCGCLVKELTSKRFKKYNQYNLDGEYGIGYTSNNEEFYFDIEDYDKIKDCCWCIDSHGYVVTNIPKQGVLLMYRVVMNAPKNMVVDHKHGEDSRNDNRKRNLRICTNQENTRNRKTSSRNTTGVTGVGYEADRNKWVAHIRFNDKNHKKRFDTFEDAVA